LDGAPPKSSRSSSEKRRSIEEYNEKTYSFMEWINSCMTTTTALRSANCEAIQSCITSLDIVRFLHEIRIFISKGTSSNAGESKAYWESLITRPEKLTSTDPEIFARHVANFITTVQCAEAAGSSLDDDAILSGYLGSLSSEFDAIKTVIIAGGCKSLEKAIAQVERNFDNIIVTRTGGGSGREKENIKTESFRVHSVEVKKPNKLISLNQDQRPGSQTTK
jgi:hypothetical protein